MLAFEVCALRHSNTFTTCSSKPPVDGAPIPGIPDEKAASRGGFSSFRASKPARILPCLLLGLGDTSVNQRVFCGDTTGVGGKTSGTTAEQQVIRVAVEATRIDTYCIEARIFTPLASTASARAEMRTPPSVPR